MSNADSSYKLLIELPYRETMALCNSSTYNAAVCSQESFWIAKANKDFGISAQDFRETTLDPAQRYLELLSINDVDIGSENFLPLDVCLARAVKKDDRVLIQYFITKGASNWNEGMAIAARQGYDDLVDFFLQVGATDYNRALKGAIAANSVSIVNKLLSRGANDINGGLFWAILTNPLMVPMFLNKGATDMDTALLLAASVGNTELSDLFIDRKALYLTDASILANNNGHTETAAHIDSR